MDGIIPPVSPTDLYARLGTASAPVLVDVRADDAFDADETLIVGAFHRSPEEVGRWQRGLPAGRSVVAYCGHGQEPSQGIAASLRALGERRPGGTRSFGGSAIAIFRFKLGMIPTLAASCAAGILLYWTGAMS